MRARRGGAVRRNQGCCCDPGGIESPIEPSADASADDPELDAERAALERIRRAQADNLEKAVARAERLATDAAEMAEGGIRDLFDADDEADAAVEAAMVRQSSDAAMHAIRRVEELRAAGSALAFGHTTGEDGERTTIGRLTVFEGDEPLVIDWRAPAAVPFYRATPLEARGVVRRRNLLYGDHTSGTPGELVAYSDELFDPDAAADEIGLRGEAALLASVTAPTREQMRSVVATIQAEQDAVIRAPADEPLVVQGGPGTGKTVVALHRAAYLLYAQREALSDTGVLVLGPSPEFLTYIAGVLPSLGETGVLSVTPPELYPGVRRGRPEPDEVAAVKGRLDMVELLANAIADRRRLPKGPFNTWYGGRRVTLGSDRLAELFGRAGQHRTHNEGADHYRFEVVEALTAEVFDPSFHNLDEARDHFRNDPTVTEHLMAHWPPLTPEQALNDLFGSRALLRSAARGTGLGAAELDLLARPRTPYAAVEDIHWSNADVPLLDELLSLVGISLGDRVMDERIRERDEADEFERAAAADERAAADSSDDDEDGDANTDDNDDDAGWDDDTESLDELVGTDREPGDPMFDTSVLDKRYEVDEGGAPGWFR
ncbi:MAG: hypothetical protein S0880_32540 [Actinomycetota bacterium]|nr:hypothetical protein [Actinomycetota bacterium]